MVDARPVGSQAHHGCSPDPLHAWLPIASDSAVASFAASASTWWSSPSLLQRCREREGGREDGGEKDREGEMEMGEGKRVNPEDEVKQHTR